MSAVRFTCACGKIEGQVKDAPRKGNHLLCYCASCRAGALHCGTDVGHDDAVDLYLTTPDRVTINKGQGHLAAFVFSPKGILRWKASCCGVQMFSSQHSPKTAFMSVRTDRLDEPEAIGPVVSKAFVPVGNGKTQMQGKRAFARLIFAAIAVRLSGKWRSTPLYDPETLAPIASVTLIPREEKAALLASHN